MTSSRSDTIRYGKPSLTNLPRDLWVRITDQIMNTPRPDFSDTDQEIERIRNQILAERAERNG